MCVWLPALREACLGCTELSSTPAVGHRDPAGRHTTQCINIFLKLNTIFGKNTVDYAFKFLELQNGLTS